MKKVMKSAVVAFALALSLSLGVGVTADAAKVTVKKVTSVDKLTGKGNKKSNRITLAKGKKATLKTTVTVTPNTSANKKVTYKTSNKKIATVSSKGVITAKKVGTATITVTSKKNKKKTAKVYVKVVKGYVKKVTVDKKTAVSVALDPGASQKYSVKVATKGKNPNKTLVCKSDNSDVATASVKSGKVTVKAVAPGTAKITLQSTDGTNKKATITVTVNGTRIALGKKDVAATVELADASKVADDFEALVKAAGLKDEDKVTLTINERKTATTKSVAEARAYLKANKVPTSVKLTVKADQADKITAVVAFAPASVKSVTIENVKFTEIKADTFKVGDTTYTYKVDGKDIVVYGHVAKAFEALKTAEVATVVEE